MPGLQYYRRIFAAYLRPQKSQLAFWHEVPEVNDAWRPGELGPYPMPFRTKADYSGEHDADGIPLLNYHGAIGLQYNPIAIAQYGLGNYDFYHRTRSPDRKARLIWAANWLKDNLEPNPFGIGVWNHHFDWDYRTPLVAPWYSGLAQGQGISLLVRAYEATGNELYMDTARRAFESFEKTVDEGGVRYVEDDGFIWFEEYLVSPPTHILNGFIWASWGVYDYFLATQDARVMFLFDEAMRTLEANLARYDTGYWSLYEQSGTRLDMLASCFYHDLHIVQLGVLYRLTGKPVFREFKNRWEDYRSRRKNRAKARMGKVLFKLCYY